MTYSFADRTYPTTEAFHDAVVAAHLGDLDASTKAIIVGAKSDEDHVADAFGRWSEEAESFDAVELEAAFARAR